MESLVVIVFPILQWSNGVRDICILHRPRRKRYEKLGLALFADTGMRFHFWKKSQLAEICESRRRQYSISTSALTILVRARPEDELRQICEASLSLWATERSANRSFSTGSCHQWPDSNNAEDFESTSSVRASNPKEASITAISTTLVASIFQLAFGYMLSLVFNGSQAIGFKSFDDQSKPMRHRPRNARNSF